MYESDLGNRDVMAQNIKRNMILKGVTATDVCNALGFPQATFSYWLHARTYPRIDKIEMMANYFGITKADLVEHQEIEKSTGEKTDGLSKEESELIQLFRRLSAERQREYLVILQALIETQQGV